MAGAVRVVLNPHCRNERAAGVLRVLREHVIGQDEALERIVDTYQTLLAGLHSRQRPLANFLFLGPTGSGKTHVVETLAEALFHNPQALVKVDCAEFQHSHEIAKLVGSPPGYLGHRETHPIFTQDALDQFQTAETPLCLVLLDEIEKASDALWQLLLGILDKGSLTLGDNRRVNFGRAMIFMTSNLGAADMQRMLHPQFGFAPPAPGALTNKLASAAVEAARRKFSPEFFNRLDHVVVFQPLEREQLERVLDLELEAVRQRLNAGAGGAGAMVISCSPRARDYLLAEGADARFGARHLKRAIERRLVHPLANLIATHQLSGFDRVIVDCVGVGGEAGLIFTREALVARAAS